MGIPQGFALPEQGQGRKRLELYAMFRDKWTEILLSPNYSRSQVIFKGKPRQELKQLLTHSTSTVKSKEYKHIPAVY